MMLAILTRTIYFFLFVILIFWAPWWMTLGFIVMSHIGIRHWWEGVVLAFMIDILMFPLLPIPIVSLSTVALIFLRSRLERTVLI